MKKIVLLASVVLLSTSCVSRRLYNELNEKHKDCTNKFELLTAENEENKATMLNISGKNKMLENELTKAVQEKNKWNSEYNTLSKNFQDLEKNSDAAIKAEIARLNNLKAELDTKSHRVSELESKLDEQDKNLKKLKDALSKALFKFEGNGLTVQQKDGKVYVSMENKLLFSSGSWTVSNEGRNAVQQLGNVLAENPDISILIEGHTDNDVIVGTLGGGITNNWELSTKRATAIVNLLETNPLIDKKNLTAAGRGEFAPIAPNTTPEGKAKNRRIEVILTPKLDIISKMLTDL